MYVLLSFIIYHCIELLLKIFTIKEYNALFFVLTLIFLAIFLLFFIYLLSSCHHWILLVLFAHKPVPLQIIPMVLPLSRSVQKKLFFIISLFFVMWWCRLTLPLSCKKLWHQIWTSTNGTFSILIYSGNHINLPL